MVLVNMETQTVSFFNNGTRMCDPIALPESMKNVPLFPLVSFKGCRVCVNFGPTQYAAVPMQVRLWSDMAAADAVRTDLTAPTDGRHRVVLPVGLPGEGTYDFWIQSSTRSS